MREGGNAADLKALKLLGRTIMRIREILFIAGLPCWAAF
jgi:hypothetical protein